jgi:hypothetical protein
MVVESLCSFAKNYDKSSSFMKLRMEAKGKQGASVSAMGNFTAGGGGAGELVYFISPMLLSRLIIVLLWLKYLEVTQV